MKGPGFIAISALLFCSFAVLANGQQAPAPLTTPESTIMRTDGDEDRSRRERAYVKVFEGQKQIWKSQRLQTQAGKANAMRLAKAAFQSAIQIDPAFAEPYTALAELAVTIPPVDIDEGIKLATQAVKIDPQNFGGHRILARLYTVKSRINSGTPDTGFADLALTEWRQVTRLDPRNAEGWAFISAIAEVRRPVSEQIDALRAWVSAAPPLDTQFYSRVMGGDAELSSEQASLKLAAALAKTGKKVEAASFLSSLIADDARNDEAIVMLGDLIDSTEGESALASLSALKQAVFANPQNVSLIGMLASLQSRLGQFDEAVAMLEEKTALLGKSNIRAAAVLSIALGELYLDRDRYDDAAKAFENAIEVRGALWKGELEGEEHEFAVNVFEKLIQTYRLAEKPPAAKAVIERARKAFGKDDIFADRQLISVLEMSGERPAALALVRTLREKRPGESNLVRIEASILTDLGKVDLAVETIKTNRTTAQRVSGGSAPSGNIIIPAPSGDEYSDLLFISSLYTRAGRWKEAIESANSAFTIANGIERRQIAKMTLATALQMSGDHSAAEAALRDVLKQMPANPIALNNLGYFLAERGERLDEAVEMIKQALAVDPKNPSYLDSLGWAYFKLGKLDEAEKYLRMAARADAYSATIREHLGDVFLEKKDSVRARESWGKALRFSSDSGDIERLKKKIGK